MIALIEMGSLFPKGDGRILPAQIIDQKENDIIVEFGNVKVCLDPNSAEMLSHTVIHYEESNMSAGFKFSNQKAANTCGCGASFSEQEVCPSNSEAK